MQKNRAVTLFSVFLFLSLFAAVVVLCFANVKNKQKLEALDKSYTEYVFVYVTDETTSITDNSTEPHTVNLTLKEYCGMIGVFSADGKLVRAVEIYTKTLPEADRILLREGIRVYSEKELNAIIEDYSS